MRGSITHPSRIRTSLTWSLPVSTTLIVLALIASIEVVKSASLHSQENASLSSATSPLRAWEGRANYQTTSELVESSKRAIIETGFSEKYFDEHFHLVSAIAKPNDMRVVWKFSLNEYDTSVIDSLGYYTEKQRRKYVHSIKNTLGLTGDISKAIPRSRAAALMKSCLGNYSGEAVVLMRLSMGERVSLFLTAHSVSTTVKAQNKEKSDQEPNGTKDPQNAKRDRPEREPGTKAPPPYLGYVNLETGKCTRSRAVVTP